MTINVRVKLGHNATNRSNIFISGHGILHIGESAKVPSRDVKPGGLLYPYIVQGLLKEDEGSVAAEPEVVVVEDPSPVVEAVAETPAEVESQEVVPAPKTRGRAKSV